MRLERAVEIGRAGLLRLAGDPEQFARFTAETGVDVADLRARLDDPELLGFVLEFLAQNEESAAALCAEESLTPEAFAAARALLPGGAAPHWT